MRPLVIDWISHVATSLTEKVMLFATGRTFALFLDYIHIPRFHHRRSRTLRTWSLHCFWLTHTGHCIHPFFLNKRLIFVLIFLGFCSTYFSLCHSVAMWYIIYYCQETLDFKLLHECMLVSVFFFSRKMCLKKCIILHSILIEYCWRFY